MKGLFFLFLCISCFAAEENFLLLDGVTNEKIVERGQHIYDRVSPCSTFKIALSLMGFEEKVLTDVETPLWHFQDGYDAFLPSWKNPQTPKSWMASSCVWFSKMLALELGLEKCQSYLALFKYGNEDLSVGLVKPGPLNPGWINSSLKISPYEQVLFLRKMIQGKLPISSRALLMTKDILFHEELQTGWKLFGKTGGCGANETALGWFVGWIEKDDHFFPFAYLTYGESMRPEQRIARVKNYLLASSKNFQSTESGK